MKRHCLRFAALAAMVAFVFSPTRASAQTAPSLGSAASFAVLGGETVTNTGPTRVTGNLGVSPGSAVTGFPPGVVVSGTIHAADSVAAAAQASLTTAYLDLAGRTCTQTLTGQDLGNRTLTPGVYCFSSSAQLTGTLVLDAQGNPNAVFIFQIGTTLTTAANAVVTVANGGQPCNVFWQVGSSATLGTGSTIAGNILALTSITMTTNASLAGRALARNGAVTLDSNTVSAALCPGAVPGPTCPAITLSPATLPGGFIGVPYNQTLIPSGGASPYTFSVSAGAPPAGLTLSAAGVITGTPTAASTGTFTVRVTDGNGCFSSAIFSIVLAPCPAITFTPPVLPGASVGVPYSQTLTGSGGRAPYVFTITAGALPAGLTLTAAGVVAGTPTTNGTSAVTIRATDANGCFADRSFSVLVTTPVPTLPQFFMFLLAIALMATAYMRLRVGVRGNG